MLQAGPVSRCRSEDWATQAGAEEAGEGLHFPGKAGVLPVQTNNSFQGVEAMTLTPASVSIPESDAAALYVGIELSASKWLLAFSDGGDNPRMVPISAGDSCELMKQVEKAKLHFALSPDSRVFSCYEAGRDGFWVHRLLVRHGIENVVVDAASMKVDRKGRRAKTDPIDARGLVQELMRYHRGDRGVWKVVHVPSEEVEDKRRFHRNLERLKKERVQHRVRIGSLLAMHGIPTKGVDQALRDIDTAVKWDGKPLPPDLKREVVQERARLDLVIQQIRELEAERKRRMQEGGADIEKVRRLVALQGIGVDSAWLLTMEFFWRSFRNRREVGGAAGLGGTPYSSGSTEREQGISKAGNALVRSRMTELAWLWVQYQPNSRLTRWFKTKYAEGGGRRRRAGIVAVARLLLVGLWHYLEHGVVPAGAILRPLKTS